MQRKGDTPATLDLFADQTAQPRSDERIGPGSWLFRGFALSAMPQLLSALEATLGLSPFRHMQTPSGLSMSAALSSCGQLGWITDRHGYRYSATDPQTGQAWPAMPDVFMQLAQDAALAAGYAGFVPDACLINRYIPGARMSLHQDRNEHDHRWPVVSVSLGIPAIFQFEACCAATRPNASPCFMGTLWFGVTRTGCASTAFCQSSRPSIRNWVSNEST